jgi:hypothetical protein
VLRVGVFRQDTRVVFWGIGGEWDFFQIKNHQSEINSSIGAMGFLNE